MLQALPALAQQSTTQESDGALAKQLADSEARVRMLQQRVDRLENRLDQLSRALNPGGAPPVAQSAPPSLPPAAPPRMPPVAKTSSGPGSFDVDVDAAQRALERTLTQQGALLLPQGSISVTPGITYTRAERSSAALVNVVDPATSASSTVLDNQTLRRNEFEARVDIKAGLPMESQLEVGIPYNYVRSSRIDAFGNEVSANGNGFGDLSIGIAKTLAHEKGAMPDLIGRLSYNTGTGTKINHQVAFNAGYPQLAAEVVALKRQDPLAFFAGASYAHVFEEDGIKPGNVTNLSLGTVLAASPATSLQFGFTQTYSDKQEVNGVKLNGSDQTYGMVNVGASSVLSRDVMLLVTTGIGVGGDAPRYSFSVALPITFR